MSGGVPGDASRRDGAAIGIGFISGGPMGIGVEGRYVSGRSDLEIGTVGDTESCRTRSFLLLFGLGF